MNSVLRVIGVSTIIEVSRDKISLEEYVRNIFSVRVRCMRSCRLCIQVRVRYRSRFRFIIAVRCS